MAGQPDPKPRKPLRLSRAKLAVVVAAARQRDRGCVLCILEGRDAPDDWCRITNGHHVVDRADGDDVVENIATLGGSGTVGHHGRVTHRNQVALDLMRRWIEQTPEVKAYVIDRVGQAGLDRRYPYLETVCPAYDCWNAEPCPDHPKEVPA